VRAVDGGVVQADEAIVVDQPWLAQVVPSSSVVAGGDPARTSAVLDIDRASDVVRATVVGEPAAEHGAALTAPVAGGILGDIETARRCLAFFGLADLAATPVTVRPDLAVEVSLRDEPRPPVRVGWWAQDGRLYSDGGPAGTGRLIAYLAGRWADRYAFAAIASGEDSEFP
jgi:hypothetical protein